MPSAGDDDDEFLFRPVWETDDEEAPPGAPPRRQSSAAPDYVHPLLDPLARAQHAVTRLDARVEAAAPIVAEGLRAGLALREAAGWLAWARFSIHPRDLALRDAGLTGAYGPAALADRLAAQLPATTAQGTIFELAIGSCRSSGPQHGPILAAARRNAQLAPHRRCPGDARIASLAWGGPARR